MPTWLSESATTIELRDVDLMYGSLKVLKIGEEVGRTLSLSEDKLKPLLLEEPVLGEELMGSSLRDQILSFLKGLGVPAIDVDIRRDEYLGQYIIAVLDCDARQALEYWVRVAGELRGQHPPIFVKWTGNTDVTPEEMGAYAGKALAKMNVFLITKEPIDISETLKEEWGP